MENNNPQTIDQKRNLNPHAEAIAAMYLYGDEYAAQGGGSMDFWDKLSESRKNICRAFVVRILQAKDVAHG